jgi:hypothetical protein
MGAAGSLVRPAMTQEQVEVSLYTGIYRPTRILASYQGVTAKQLNSVTWGLRVTTWGPGRLGFEASVGYAPSALEINPAYRVPEYGAHVWTASLKALLRVLLPVARGQIHVSGGVGRVALGGDAYDPGDYTGPTTFYGGIANVGGVIKVAGPVGLRFDGEDFVYAAHLGPCRRTGPGFGSVCDVYSERAGYSTGSMLENDLQLSLGLVFVAWRSTAQGWDGVAVLANPRARLEASVPPVRCSAGARVERRTTPLRLATRSLSTIAEPSGLHHASVIARLSSDAAGVQSNSVAPSISTANGPVKCP